LTPAAGSIIGTAGPWLGNGLSNAAQGLGQLSANGGGVLSMGGIGAWGPSLAAAGSAAGSWGASAAAIGGYAGQVGGIGGLLANLMSGASGQAGSGMGPRVARVNYGESSLSLAALSHRIANRARLFPGQNIAAFQVGDEIRVFESLPDVAHAEEVGLNSLTAAEKLQVTAVFSELRPCSLSTPNCMGLLNAELPNLSEITYSFVSNAAKKAWLFDLFRDWQ